MKRNILFVMTLVISAFGFSSAAAQQIKINPGAKTKDQKLIKVIRPDLRVTDPKFTKTPDNFVETVSFSVMNVCEATSAASYALVTFKPSAGGEIMFLIGHEIGVLKGGASTSQTFNVANQKIPAGSYIRIEADPYKKVKEGDEDNNWVSLNPQSSPFPKADVCSPK